MKEKITLAGRSMIFNIIFILLNFAGLTFMVMGYHENFQEQKTLFLFLGLILLILSIGGLIIFKGRMMMSSVARVLVGGLFIVSGLVKANDPIGFAYKLEEYFEDGALAFRIKEWFGVPGFSLEALIPWALALSIFICIGEIVLGVMAIIGGKIKLTSYLMAFMMVFFTFLTWHTANCDPDKKFLDRDTYAATDPIATIKINESKTNKDIKIVSQDQKHVVVDEMKQPQCVSDCGCFGDAMKGSVGRSLTPKESLWKDIVLLYLVVWIFVSQWSITPNTRKENMIFVPASLVVIGFFSWVFSWLFPVWFGILCIVSSLWILNLRYKYFNNHWVAALAITLWVVLMEIFVMRYAPLKDYRPYAVGANLYDKMHDEIKGQSVSYYFITNLETNKTKRVDMNDIDPEVWSNKEKWKYKFDTTEWLIKPKNASIMDFKPFIYVEDMSEAEWDLPFIKQMADTSQKVVYEILDLNYNSTMKTPEEEYDPEFFPAEEYKILDTLTELDPEITEFEISDAILAQDKIVLLISKKFDEANWKTLDKIKEIYAECQKKNIPFILITNTSREDINKFREENKIDIPAFVLDEIELKVISRSNPTVLVLDKAIVTGKYPFRSIPNGETFKNKHLK